jgi:hypothetical protein
MLKQFDSPEREFLSNARTLDCLFLYLIYSHLLLTPVVLPSRFTTDYVLECYTQYIRILSNNFPHNLQFFSTTSPLRIYASPLPLQHLSSTSPHTCQCLSTAQ